MTGSSTPKVIVVGGGIVGAACAEALADDGCPVTVLEGGLVGTGATAASMGHLVVMDDSEAQLALSSWSRRRWTERARELPPDCEDLPSGTLWLARDEAEMGEVREKATRYVAHGEDVEVLESADLRRAEPELRPGLAGALRVPADRVVYPTAATRFLLERAVAHGARVREHSAVEEVEPRRARTGDTWMEADLVVVAAGAASRTLVPELPIEPRRGHLVITDRYPGFLGHQVIELGYLREAHATDRDSVAFNVQPRKTGQLLIGSSRELVGWDPRVDDAVRHRMLRRAAEFMPGLSPLHAIRTWTGFRPATPDGLPFIGEWEPGLLVAAGHEGLGITTALGTARLIADLAGGRAPALDPRPFDPRRHEVTPA